MRPQFFPDADHQPLREAIRHAVRSDIASPLSRASSASSRVPTGSSWCASNSAFTQAASHHLAWRAMEIGQPPVVGLAGELEHPTRHRHRDPQAANSHPGGEPAPRQGFALRRTCPPPPQHLVRRSSSSAAPTRGPSALRRCDGPGTRVDVGATQPLLQRRRWGPEVVRDLLDRPRTPTAPERRELHRHRALGRVGLEL